MNVYERKVKSKFSELLLDLDQLCYYIKNLDLETNEDSIAECQLQIAEYAIKQARENLIHLFSSKSE